MKTFNTLILATLLSVPAFAGKLPLQVNRNADGTLDTIVLVDQKSSDEQDAYTFIDGLASGVNEASTYTGDVFEGSLKLKKEEQKALVEARNAFAVKSMALNSLDRQLLDREFVRAVTTLNSQQVFHLLAAPSNPGAFDGEKAVVDIVKLILSQGSNVLGVTPAYEIFDFMVSEYLNALIARREFFQNAILAQLAFADTDFTATEASLIRSSIFYSRLDLWNIPKREKAIKTWATFGDTSAAKWMKKCKVDESTYAHACFTQEGGKVRNLVNAKYVLSSRSSLAVDLTHANSVGNTRWIILAVKLGVKLLPAPGLVKKPVYIFINSLYEEQRRTEGLLYGSLLEFNMDDLAYAVRGNNANPTF